MIRSCAAVLVAAAFTAPAIADDAAEMGLLARAVAFHEADAAGAPRFSYRQQLRSGEDATMVVAFDPSQAEGARWRWLAPVGDARTRKQEALYEGIQDDPEADRALLLDDPSNLTATCTSVAAQTVDAVTFACAAPDTDDEGTQSLREHLRSQVTVTRAPARIASVRVFATKPFKPQPVAKIERFEMTMTFEPAWEDGPTILTDMTQEVSGSALFQSFDETVTITIRDPQPVG